MRHLIEIAKNLFENSLPPEGNVARTIKVGPVTYDQQDGLGSTPYNMEIKYRGFVALMTPVMFLNLASPRIHPHDYVLGQLKEGHPIGSPFLLLELEDNKWAVTGHEGRGRTSAIRDLYGDIPILVHCIPRTIRARHLSLESINNFRNAAFIEDSSIVRKGPNCLPWVWWQDGWKNLDQNVSFS